MKTLVFSLLLLMASANSFAQAVWAPPGATWYYSYSMFSVVGYIKIQVGGDVIVDSVRCRALETSVHYYDHMNGNFGSYVRNPVYTALINDTVFVWGSWDSSFHFLYDLSPAVGDTWDHGIQTYNACPDSVNYEVVDSIGTCILGGDTLVWSHVSPFSNAWYYLGGKIIDRIGCYDAYMFPEMWECIFDATEGGPFRCYYDNTIGMYHKPGMPPCDFIVGIQEQPLTVEAMKVYPNPASQIVTIELSDRTEGKVEVKVLDLQGKAISCPIINLNPIQVDCSSLRSSSYFIRVTDSRGREWVSRLITQ